MKALIVTLVLSLLGIFTSVCADELEMAHWNLPRTLSDDNTSIRFELDSTWHTVHGTVSGIKGSAKLLDPANLSSVALEITIQVANLDTDNSMRDDKMRSVMSADTFRVIRFESDGLRGACTPAVVLADSSCSDRLDGTLQIRNVRKAVSIPVDISKGQGHVFYVKGSFPVRWKEFGVEDPSILIASVEPVVTIFFESKL